MSTQLGVINNTVSVTRFFGGADRGTSIQLTCKNGYVQLNASEIVALLPMLKSVVDLELGRKKAECERAIKECQDLEKTIVKDMQEVSEMAISQRILDCAVLLSLGKAVVTDGEE